MNNETIPSDDPPDDEALPPRLREALARLDKPDIDIPLDLDARILSRAKSDFIKRLRFRPVVRWVAACASIAAAIVVVFIVRATLFRPAVHLAKGDINANGKVDMLDAYLLARHLAAAEKLDPKWDMNGDGVVDQADVDWIANHAVQINPASNGGAQ